MSSDRAVRLDPNWKPSKAQRERLRYWDFYIYWVDQSLRRQRGETTDQPPTFRVTPGR